MSKDTADASRPETPAVAPWAPWASLFPGAAYAVDAWQRTILYWDVMRERGNEYLEHAASKTPNVLSFPFRIILDGRSLERPVNYYLVRIEPPADVPSDPRKRPIVVIDPRAGQAPGIGGFRADSEIGVAMREGHPCYFMGFLAEPVHGQTLGDVILAEGRFLEKVIELQPEAEQKPLVIGNCQAGWAVMMLAAARPDLFGAVLIAGAPLSYWNGVHGKNPMRYTGGLLGGSWLTALAGDLGNGKFDGTSLVSNFESLNPANTLWTKQYNLWSKVDTEAERYLGFERWWGNHVLLNAEEMQVIADELFIGNRLATAEIVTKAGVRLDLREIKAPIVCFCSKGDNITPPQQALGWILDLYTVSRTSGRKSRQSSTPCTTSSAISASSSRARWRGRNTPSSRATSISSTSCRPVSTRRCWCRSRPRTTMPTSSSAISSSASRRAPSTTSGRWAAMTRRTSGASPPLPASRRSITGSTAPSCSPGSGPR